jgi:hypothetical protein
LAFAVVLAPSAARAGGPDWNGPGYYLLELFFQWGIDGGPYATKEQCMSVLATKAVPMETDEYRCEYFKNADDLDRELNSALSDRFPSSPG